MRIKHGASIQGLDIRMRPVLIQADHVWRHLGNELVITSGLDGEHSSGSLHYYGLAVDFRTSYFNEQQISDAIEMLRGSLSADFDVVRETNHIHVEYDPK